MQAPLFPSCEDDRYREPEDICQEWAQKSGTTEGGCFGWVPTEIFPDLTPGLIQKDEES